MNGQVVYQAASICLSYPDDEVLGLGEVVRRALAESAPRAAASFAPLLDWWATTTPADVQRAYVDVFDLSKRHALYLSYWTDGDTRRRGMVLAEFKQRFREAGLELGETGELPDYLPLVLEFARHRPDAGAELLQSYRASLELIRLALGERGAPHAGVLAAVCATLPGRSPEDRQQAMAMAAMDSGVVPTGLFIESLNEMIDAQGKRLMALRSRVPNVVLLALYGVATVAGAFSGYAGGLGARSSLLPVYVMIMLVCAVILLIQDLDRPSTGFITTSQQPMIDAAAAIAAY